MTQSREPEPEYMAASPEIVGGLIELASSVLLSKFPRLSADETDIELLLEALHLLRPAKAGIRTLYGALYLSRGYWDDAIRILRDVSQEFAPAQALLAYSLLITADPEWKRYADEALETSPDPDTERPVSARPDPMQAEEETKRAWQPVEPAPVTALSAFREKAPPVQDVTPPLTAIARSAYSIPGDMMFMSLRA